MIVTSEKWLRMAADRRFCAVPVERICLRFAGLEEVQVDRGRAPETERKGLTLRGSLGYTATVSRWVETIDTYPCDYASGSAADLQSWPGVFGDFFHDWGCLRKAGPSSNF